MSPTEEQERLRYLRLKAKAAQGAPSNEAIAPTEAAPEPVDSWTALARGLGQGATLRFGDEAGGLVQALGEKYLPESWGGGGEQASRASLAGLYRQNRDSFRGEDAAAQKAHGGFYGTGDVLGGVPLAIATAGKGGTLGALMKTGALLGAGGGLGGSDADLTRGEALGAMLDTGVGGMLGGVGGAAGYGVGKAVNAGAQWLAGKAAQRVSQATGKIAQLAEKSAGEVTQSARSAAGTSATAAYKNATNIEEAIKAGAMTLEDLTPDELSLYRGLLRERAGKAARDLAADAGRKIAKGAEYEEALASHPGRAMEAASRIGNPWNQIKPVLGRYWMPMLGSAAGYLMGGHSLGAAGAGGLAARALSPTVHALARRASHASIQRPLWETLGGLARGVGRLGMEGAPALGNSSTQALTPEIEEKLLPMLLAAMGQQQEPQPQLAAVGANR